MLVDDVVLLDLVVLLLHAGAIWLGCRRRFGAAAAAAVATC